MGELKVLATEREVPFKGLTRQKVLDDLKANGWLPDDRPPPEIKESAARNYLHWLGFHQAVCGKGVFVDGHDRPDVVLYRPEFCAKYMEYYRSPLFLGPTACRFLYFAAFYPIPARVACLVFFLLSFGVYRVPFLSVSLSPFAFLCTFLTLSRFVST